MSTPTSASGMALVRDWTARAMAETFREERCEW